MNLSKPYSQVVPRVQPARRITVRQDEIDAIARRLIGYFAEGLVAPIIELISSLYMAALIQGFNSLEEASKSLTGSMQQAIDPVSYLLTVFAIMMIFEIVRNIAFAFTHVAEAIAYLVGIFCSYILLDPILKSLGADRSVYISLAIPIIIGLSIRFLLWYLKYKQEHLAWY